MKVGRLKRKRIGIFAGTFDPVHIGHITFALQALTQASLDEVVFIPERRPRNKQGPEHFAHRVAMIRQAIKPHQHFAVLELVESHLSVNRTLPHLRTVFPDADLVLLVGSDVLPSIPTWPGAARLLQQVEIVVGVRAGESPEAMELHVATWLQQPLALHVFPSFAPAASSREIRRALRRNDKAPGVLASVRRYSLMNWLYVRLPGVKSGQKSTENS
ncbi:nicotinate-nucleotide adenylyltransferase [soil metagenome]